jgi:hypothetical protein
MTDEPAEPVEVPSLREFYDALHLLELAQFALLGREDEEGRHVEPDLLDGRAIVHGAVVVASLWSALDAMTQSNVLASLDERGQELLRFALETVAETTDMVELGERVKKLLGRNPGL